VFVITTIEPYVKPLLGTATEALANTSQEVLNTHDQEIVWNDWNCSDPTHSFLSKVSFRFRNGPRRIGISQLTLVGSL
jgi:hypothetical protein